MALNWLWSGKVGEAEILRHFKNKNGEEKTWTQTVSLYEGNAFMIFIYEYKDEDTGKDMYSLYSFFSDKNHAKILLGLSKDSEGNRSNIFNEGSHKLVKLTLDKKKFSTAKVFRDFVTLMADAFEELEISLRPLDSKTTDD